MENTLLNYMNRRFGEQSQKPVRPDKPAGPVITISREVGCGGIKVGQCLADELNQTVFCKRWQVISKEVLSASAAELKVSADKVNRLFSTSEHYTFDEVLAAFTDKYYKSSKIITKTVGEVIYNFAKDGCCIIVGRAGHLIAADIENSLHVRLVAPLAWRIEALAKNKNLSHHDARKYIEETEKEREIFRQHFLKNREEHERFDLTIDVSRFDQSQVTRLILSAFDARGIPERLNRKVNFF